QGRLQVEALVAHVLLWGGLVSIALVVVGLGLSASHEGFRSHSIDLSRVVRPGRHAHPADVFVSLGEVYRGVTAHPIDPAATIALGLIVLLATPVLGVAVAIVGFLAAGDRQYAAVAAIVFAMLVLAALLTG